MLVFAVPARIVPPLQADGGKEEEGNATVEEEQEDGEVKPSLFAVLLMYQ